MEGSLLVEDTQGTERMQVGVGIYQISEGLRCDEHGRHGILDRRELLLEELSRRGVSDSGELPVE